MLTAPQHQATTIAARPGQRALQRPLDLPRLVMRRAAVVVVLGVLLLLVLGLARMRDTVADELSGARMLAQLARQLSTLQHLPDAQARQTLKQWQAEGSLRHLRVMVVDGSGMPVVDDLPEQRLSAPMRWLTGAGAVLFRPGPSFTVAWPLQRPEGAPWQATLTAVPDSERLEALTSLLEGVLLLAGVGLLMLAVMAWNTRRAFQPMSQLLGAIATLEAAPAEHGAARAATLPTMPIAELETVAAALRHLDTALATAEQQRRRLAGQVLSLQEDERQRLARELHDEFGQRLTALRVNAAWLLRQLQGQPACLPVVQQMAAQCEDIQQDVRAMLARLRPLVPESGGVAFESLPELGRLLQGLVADWRRTAGHDIDFVLSLQLQDADGAALPWPQEAAAPQLPREVVLALYRISQEALTNVARHSGGATRAQLSLGITLPLPTQTELTVAWSVHDNGVGLAETQAAYSRGNGLAGVKERLWALGADLHITPTHALAARPGCHLSAHLRLPMLPTVVPPPGEDGHAPA